MTEKEFRDKMRDLGYNIFRKSNVESMPIDLIEELLIKLPYTEKFKRVVKLILLNKKLEKL